MLKDRPKKIRRIIKLKLNAGKKFQIDKLSNLSLLPKLKLNITWNKMNQYTK